MNMNGMDMTTSTSSMDMNGVDMTTSTSLMDTTMTSSQLDSLLTSAMEAMTGMTSMSEMTSSESMKMNMDTSSEETTMTGMEHMSSMSSTMAATMTAMTGMTTMSGMSKMSGMATMSGMSGMSGMAHTTGMSGMSSMVMSTSASSGHKKVSCTMSMLWNWHSKDVCFISRQWRTSSAGLFAGTCIGVFALLLAINWWRRILNQYKIYCAELRADEVENVLQHGGTLATREVPFTSTKMENRNMFVEMMIPFAETWKHQWLWALNKNLAVQCGDQVYIYPSVFEHLIYCVGDTMEWSVHHVIMLLFMYFNGYVFISCMIGAGVGFLLFQYKNINFSKRGDNVSKRCCL